ncbi:hypothetical protein BaOVIS_013760 [Babesia ovis]|uniref:Uncharacterized protein n=1 Tax=Babesia ovis TaxID=5869 RepID=A0A9W5TCM3_BABOV|nr:hypothetical protein BaOVIS_013760 [Babesia ovis]
MAKVPLNKNRSKGAREELSYPASPRSKKWIVNLLPVLEGYNYNFAEIIQLVKSCDYNNEKIQQEVDRIMEINIGHEQGEWTVVKPQQKVKPAPSTKGHKTGGHGFRRDGAKPGHVPETKSRRQRNAKDTTQPMLVKQTVEVITSAAPGATQPIQALGKEVNKNTKDKKQGRDTHKDTNHKDVGKDVNKSHQQNAKKIFPVQWAALLKSKPEDTNLQASPAVKSTEAGKSKAGRKTVEEKVLEKSTNSVKVDDPRDVDAIALAQAEETLKKIEVQAQQKLLASAKAAIDISPTHHHLDLSPKHPQGRQSLVDLGDMSPVVMPKPLSGDIDASSLFVFFDDDSSKGNGWSTSSPAAPYQQPSGTRRDNYSRASNLVSSESNFININLQHEGNPLVSHDVPNIQQHDQLDSLPGYSSQLQQNSTHDGSFQGHWQMSYYGNRYSNTKHQPFSYGYEEEKHKNYRQSGNDHYAAKDNRHPVNGVYVNYSYQPERLQSPPGLVGFYTPQQPFYGFPNSTGQANPHPPSDSMTSSMWRN